MAKEALPGETAAKEAAERNGIFEEHLDKTDANYQPLTPLSFLHRAEGMAADRTAVIHGPARTTYADFAGRCRRLTDALRRRGVGTGDTVAVLLPNIPAMLECHYGVPGAGAVLNPINYRLDAATVAFILEHGEAKVFIVDSEFGAVTEDALARLRNKPLVVRVDDALGPQGQSFGDMDYESLLSEGDDHAPFEMPRDEWQAISLAYTSGTTGDPKGVVYHHRGAFLNAIGNALVFGIRPTSVYLWTLPMFHCNGWSYPWGITAMAATHVCLRQVEPAPIFRAIADHGVTHMCGAPVVLTMLIHAPDQAKEPLARVANRTVEFATGGAAPPAAVIEGMEAMGFRVTHLYGLTESFGPSTYCMMLPEWGDLDLGARSGLMARQGVAYPTVFDLMVADPETDTPLPADGETLGEIMLRGNTIMKGYVKNPKATDAAFRNGWYHTGDLAVMHPDGYVEVKDRSKDIIISGGENISSLELEQVLYRHPAIMEAAVVAAPDEKWGETPCAFVTLKPDAKGLTVDAVIDWCRTHLAHFKVPRKVVFGPLPKTSTGKIQKFVLRERTKEL
ncbi:MAG: acyl-CoA synthetase [Rhodospirillales bacterium]|nr:acyl-CoA synthetase [Rhodospirillales bacterium]